MSSSVSRCSAGSQGKVWVLAIMFSSYRDGNSPSFIKNFTLPQRLGQEMTGRVSPCGGFLLAVDQDVLGNWKMGKGTPQQGRLAAPATLFAEAFPLDDQQIDIRVGTGLAAGMRAKENDALRFDFVHDHLCHLRQQVI